MQRGGKLLVEDCLNRGVHHPVAASVYRPKLTRGPRSETAWSKDVYESLFSFDKTAGAKTFRGLCENYENQSELKINCSY